MHWRASWAKNCLKNGASLSSLKTDLVRLARQSGANSSQWLRFTLPPRGNARLVFAKLKESGYLPIRLRLPLPLPLM